MKKMKEYFNRLKKDKGGKEILVELGLAVVAVALLVLFKSSISDAITFITTRLQTEITKMFG